MTILFITYGLSFIVSNSPILKIVFSLTLSAPTDRRKREKRETSDSPFRQIFKKSCQNIVQSKINLYLCKRFGKVLPIITYFINSIGYYFTLKEKVLVKHFLLIEKK